MTTGEFARRLERYLAGKPEVRCEVEAGTDLWSYTCVGLENWEPTFLPAWEGRWNLYGEPTKYFGSSPEICLAELAGCGEDELTYCVTEHWWTTERIEALDVGRLPSELVVALFEKGGGQAEKWEQSHYCLRRLRDYLGTREPLALKAPSAFGAALTISGYTLAANPFKQGILLVEKWEMKSVE